MLPATPLPDRLDALSAEIRAALATRDALLRRARDYLGDGHATAPVAKALVSEIEAALTTGEGT